MSPSGASPTPATPADRLSAGQIQSRLGQTPEWTVNAEGELTRTFKLAGFARALVFTGAVGHLAEKADHHPDILIQYNRVTLSLSTHSAGGLTAKDFDLAAQVDAL